MKYLAGFVLLLVIGFMMMVAPTTVAEASTVPALMESGVSIADGGVPARHRSRCRRRSGSEGGVMININYTLSLDPVLGSLDMPVISDSRPDARHRCGRRTRSSPDGPD